MKPPYVIRKTRPGDVGQLPGVERSAAKAFLAVPGLAWIAEDTVQSVERHLELVAGGHAWVAVDDRGSPVGFVNAEPLREGLHIWECAVKLEWQRRGIGRGLIECVRSYAKQNGIAALSLTTFRHVVWNRPFYERLGFRTLPEDGIPAFLQSILDEEAANGIPVEQRCAMLCRFGRKQGGGGPGKALPGQPGTTGPIQRGCSPKARSGFQRVIALWPPEAKSPDNPAEGGFLIWFEIEKPSCGLERFSDTGVPGDGPGG